MCIYTKIRRKCIDVSGYANSSCLPWEVDGDGVKSHYKPLTEAKSVYAPTIIQLLTNQLEKITIKK
jgi:hypothetical protein